MSSTSFIDLRINNAEQFRESVSEPSPNTRLYLTYGRSVSWANDSLPPTPNTSISTKYEIWNYMIGGKKITGNDIKHVIPRHDWTNATSYFAFDDRNTNLYDANNKFYVLTDDNHVYKCLSNNNGGISTVKPTSISTTSPSETSDGYLWKYMYSLTDADLYKFTTDEYIPVRTLSTDDGSLQWDVQQNADDGAICYIIMTNGGSGYTNASNIIVTVTGDGNSFEGTAKINTASNTVSNVSITDYGTGYTYANVTFSGGGGANAAGRAVISPFGGHGSNPLYELGGLNVMINARLSGNESDTLPAENDYRQISIIKDPLLKDSTVRPDTTTFLQTLNIVTAGSGDYVVDETVYQGTTLATATFVGQVMTWDSANGSIRLINTRGDTTTSLPLVGENSGTTRFISDIESEELEKYSGQILYVDNIKPIIRSTDQTEDFKIVIKFF